MPTHLYCLLAAESDGAPPSDLPDVRALAIGDVVAWVATTTTETMSRDARRAAQLVVEHDRVVGRAVARGVTPIPATLADPYPSDEALIEDVRRRLSEVRDALNRTANAVEMAIILAPRSDAGTSDAAIPPGTGRAYLERLRDQPDRLAKAADDLDRHLSSVIVASSRRPQVGRLGLSHLVRRNDVEAYRKMALAGVGDTFRVAVDGPRAPYSFAAFSPRIEP